MKSLLNSEIVNLDTNLNNKIIFGQRNLYYDISANSVGSQIINVAIEGYTLVSVTLVSADAGLIPYVLGDNLQFNDSNLQVALKNTYNANVTGRYCGVNLLYVKV